jgi:hypothetical protein
MKARTLLALLALMFAANVLEQERQENPKPKRKRKEQPPENSEHGKQP